MDNHAFVLNFTLPGREDNPEQYLDALYNAGCDDAAIGVGQFGMIGLDFTRAAASAEDALRSAVADVLAAIPGASLAQAGPDLVGLTEMAEIFGFTRQNMRKYATGQSSAPEAFPPPVVLGDPSLWHLAEIVAWLRLNTNLRPPAGILNVSKVTAKMNFEVEQERLKRILAFSA
ncbi:MAG: DNA-binding protein [Acetobacteraceae bacterium]|nr:DNA-binding protein [Acetobacteraceae bacterium]